MMDKAGWQTIIDNEYRLSDVNELGELTNDLLDYLDSPDQELRDTIAYSVFARWIISYRYYSDQQLLHLVNLLIPKLSQTIGNQDDDTVFGRSYAALVLSLLAYQEDRSSFMTQAVTHSLLDEALNYLTSEADHRAYIEDKGWANACSNTAMLLKWLSRNSIVRSENAKRILDTIADKVTMTTTHIFQHDEDERLAQVVMTLLDLSLLTTYELGTWLDHFHNWNKSHPVKDDFDPVYHATYQNIKTFLRSVYIQMRLANSMPIEATDFEPELLTVIAEFSL